MKKKKPTSYGRAVIARMNARGISLQDLADEVERRTGRFVTEKYIYNHLCGFPTPWPQAKAIREIVGMRKEDKHA